MFPKTLEDLEEMNQFKAYKLEMIKLITILILLISPLILFGQKTEYKSSEQEKYDRKVHFKPFKPLDKKEILNFKNKWFVLEDITSYSPYTDSLIFTPYQDSTLTLMFNSIELDSMTLPEPQFIGKVEKGQILKHEKKGLTEAFVYESSEFEDKYFGESGIWVALSMDGGKTWEYFYTGIVQRQPLFLKWHSKLPLIKSENEFQIETCLLRQITPFTHPGPTPDYELVKDGLLLTLELKTLRQDSDNDGLTDIVETKFHTNLRSKDTDRDGIADNLDLNPRFSGTRSDKTVIFESALNGETYFFDTTGIKVPFFDKTQNSFVTDSSETFMIVTDLPEIQSVQPKSTRVIVVSEKDYKKFKRRYKTMLNQLYFSPLFKVDGEVDTYIFTRNLNTWGEEYLVKKTEDGWLIKIISSWIS